MAPNIKDVAERAGVSVTTVSRVLNNRGSVSEKTRTKVNRVMKELNYYPNQLAINLFKQRTMLVGLIVPDVSHPFFAAEVKYIECALQERGYRLLLCNAEENNNREREYFEMLQCNKVDGVMVASHTLDLDFYSQVNLPIVALDRYLGHNVPTVSADHEQGGRLAAQELLSKGCRHVVQIAGCSAVPTPSNRRHEVFAEILKKHDVECKTVELPLNAFDVKDYWAFSRQIFQQNPWIDGVFAVDHVACAVKKVAADQGMSVPENLKIVGYDGTAEAFMGEKILTTVAQPIEKIACTAVETLLEMISDRDFFSPGTHIKLPVRLLKGETT